MTKIPKSLHGTKITNGRKRLVLNIKPCDIKGAKPKDPTSCAAARALQRQGYTEAVVMRSVTYVNSGTRALPCWQRYETPEALTREIVAIDRGGQFEAGDYTLSPVRPSKREKPTGPKNVKKGSRPYRHLTTNIR